MDLLHARKVSQLNLQFKFAHFPRYPNFASLNTYANPLCPTYKKALPTKLDNKIQQIQKKNSHFAVGNSCILTLDLKRKNCEFDNFNLTSKNYFYEF